MSIRAEVPIDRRARMPAFTAALLALLAAAAPAQAQLDIAEDELRDLLRVKIRTVQHLALNPVMVRAARRQNASGLTTEQIARLDEEWRSTDEVTPFKLSQQQSRAGRLLKRFVERSASFNEAFLTDNQGANVAAYPATSDYWQGDEDKWTRAYNDTGEPFVGPVELDDSTQTVAVQVSAPVLDRDETIGVLVVGVTLTYLEARRR